MKFRTLLLGLAAVLAVVAFSFVDRDAKVATGFAITGALALGVVNSRTLRDANLAVTKALPAAAAANFSASIDTANVNPGRVAEWELLVECPATPALVDAKTIIFTLKDSPDNVTFTAVADLPTITMLGAGGVGAAAVARRFAPPVNLARYVRLDASVLAAGGDNTAVSYSLGFVF